MRQFAPRVPVGVVLCPLKPGQKCKISQLISLSESSRCVGCPYVLPSQYDEVLAHSPRNTTAAGMPVPAATTGGSL
jgi:hypothetical protein